jgi:hypothetical protein
MSWGEDWTGNAAAGQVAQKMPRLERLCPKDAGAASMAAPSAILLIN